MRPLAPAATLILLAGNAFAQPTDAAPAPQSPELALPSADRSPKQAYWEQGRPRWFFSATLELGFAYARPKLAAGRGRPHWEWTGIEALPLVTEEGAGVYAGLRGELPYFDARAGVRYFSPFDRSLLPEQDRHDRLDLERIDGPRGSYVAYESELALDLPLLGGSLFGVATGYYIPGLEPGYHLYEESLRVIMAPPFVWRARVGYAFGLGRDGSIAVGPAAEVIGLPGRDAAVWRAGGVAVAAISPTVDVQATFLPVISSPDAIGLAGADFGHLGVRWRWATGAVPK